ncbi:hypothetical protein [Streptomyces sp. NBC_01803]|uniref:hypothetical protein n=1 Tax=Streptomyces sp. NBC_01803 TaxID=2975946 RepID=UPI002DD9C122|nr:hypothetical protein [Streptomyces sp. NBC_01803]WSA45494.1 hypothetical protein OIE51_15580 [Streptomyces sp. NBC_01803]
MAVGCGGRRRTTGAAIAVLTLVAAVMAAGAGCSGGDGASSDEGKGGKAKAGAEKAEKAERQQSRVRLIGDGSTAYTGRQPRQPKAARLAPGETPPQFVVFSWDGAGEDGNELFSRFRQVGEKYDADMTYFLSGLYLLPESERTTYRPPGRTPGESDIGYLKDENIEATLEQLRAVWLDGSEIGTHFNGHFCGSEGVAGWSVEDWRSEIDQAKWMVRNWKTTTGFDDLEPLPFDYEKELVGGRAPCLEGQENLLKAAAEEGFRYDSSGNGLQVWPEKREGVWDIPLQSVPVPGRSFETLSMDYNFYVNGADGDQMRDGLLAAFDRAHDGNRAPLIVGNHFADWNDGAYVDAVEEVIKELCPRDDVRCVSFRQLVDWLDAQDPAVLEKLRTLGVGEQPEGGWAAFLHGTPAADETAR